MRLLFLLFIIFLLGAGCATTKPESKPVSTVQISHDREKSEPAAQGPAEMAESLSVERVDFSRFNPIFRFSAEILSDWQVEYVREIEALNVYGPAQAAMPARELSQIFIRYFNANDFLTLRTVDIFKHGTLEVQGHDAVRYDIQKKDGVPNFTHQPSWRNARHEVTDVRFAKTNPAVFYVFAHNPSLPREVFEKFLANLVFHNDRTSFVAPLDRAVERITKKPFGLQVAPDNSPVQPERFSGYHTGVDFEVFEDEKDQDVDPVRGKSPEATAAPEARASNGVEVRAFCGGPIREKRTADGYGGVVVQECLLGDQVVTVVYGHLKIDPHLISPLVKGEKAGVEYLAPGDSVGILGTAFSIETDGERKHLHFGIHKGTRADLRGYVPSEAELDRWLDPWQYIIAPRS